MIYSDEINQIKSNMFSVVFPTHFIINVNFKEFNIRYGCNLLVIICNIYFVFRVIISSCELNVVGFVKVYKELVYFEPVIYTVKKQCLYLHKDPRELN
jgi:hypothetical protein